MPPAATLAPAGDLDVAERESEAPQQQQPWVTIVWNDPVNLMTYVTFVFSKYFGYERGEAERLMLQVHMEGKAVVSHGTREQMEKDVNAMHDYGLWATMERDS